MTESSAETKKSFKYLLEKFPVGMTLTLGRNRNVIRQLAASCAALEKKLAGIDGEVKAAAKAKIESGEATPGMPVEVTISLKLDQLGPGILPLAGFVEVFEEPSNAIDCMKSVAYLLLQSDLGLSSEEFGKLTIDFSADHGYMPIVIGYAPEVFSP